jgi:alkylation response protein AidB-like acyl-CoA dehydrogenase
VRRSIFEETHDLFRASFRQFLESEVVPNAPRWEESGIVDRELFLRAGSAGFLGFDAPQTWGGGGTRDFRFNQIIGEEAQFAGVNASVVGIGLHNDVCLPYLLHAASDPQRDRWLPGICSGSLIAAVAMTEPGAGSDLAGISTSAVLDGEHYVVNGSKTFITNGINADLIITAVKTDLQQRHRGMSLLVLERGMAGFERGPRLAKVGMHAQDTAELFFNDVRVPVANRLGGEGDGFAWLVRNLPQERLNIAVSAVAAARATFDLTLEYCKERKAFGKAIGTFQHNRFSLAEMATEIDVAQAFIDACVLAHNDVELTAEDAAKAKWWCSDLQGRVVDACVQLHGGYGYMAEQPVARAWTDARVTRIYGGTNEIMKEIIGRSLGL